MPEQIGLLVLLVLFALFQFVVRALRARRTERAPEPAMAPAGHERDVALPAMPPRARAVSSPRPLDVRPPAAARRRARVSPRRLRDAVVLAAILAPPRGLEPPNVTAP